MKKLTGIIGAVALGLTLAAGLAHAQGSSTSYAYGGWNCPWASGAQTGWQGPNTHGMGGSTLKGAHTQRAMHTARSGRGYHRHGPNCGHGPRYGCYGW
jgi:hypothetical protein